MAAVTVTTVRCSRRKTADDSFDTSWGGCVLVTDKGGEPLVKRTPGMVSIS